MTAGNNDPLGAFRAAQADIEATDDESFVHYFIGAVSTFVEPDDWAKALTTAKACVLGMRERRAEATP